MVLGMSLSTFTLLHVIISLAGIGSGFIVLFGLLNGKRLDGWTKIFLTTTVLTSLTGFLFPFEGLKPSYIVGGISLVVLVIAIWARYRRRLAGAARWIYVVTAAVALYFNCFVAVVLAVLLENTRTTRHGPNREGATIRDRAMPGPGDLRRAHLSGSKAVSRCTGAVDIVRRRV